MTSREDFRDGYLNGEEPSPLRLMKMLEKDFSADDAMTSLDAETAHQMREYLREQE